jgi:hypothetical protein
MSDLMLKIYEDAHRKRCGTGRAFCYMETLRRDNVYGLSIVEQDEPGHFPLPELGCGARKQMRELAERLNRERLKIPPRLAAIIIASSMSGS